MTITILVKDGDREIAQRVDVDCSLEHFLEPPLFEECYLKPLLIALRNSLKPSTSRREQAEDVYLKEFAK